MTLKKFIKENLKELSDYIKRQINTAECPNIEEIELWINNDENLYKWAKREGVSFE